MIGTPVGPVYPLFFLMEDVYELVALGSRGLVAYQYVGAISWDTLHLLAPDVFCGFGGIQR